MKIRIMITRFITTTMLVFAMTIIGLNGTAEAQHVRVFDGVTFAAVIPEHTLRFCVSDLTESGQDSQTANSQRSRAVVLIHDTDGNVLARSLVVELLPGQIHIFDFDRDDLPAAGEAGTRRLQVRASIQVSWGDGSVRSIPPQIIASVELVETRTGKTVNYSSVSGKVTAIDYD